MTNSGNGRFYLKRSLTATQSSHVQIVKFSNWNKCAFKNFYFDHLFQVTLMDDVGLLWTTDKENLKEKKNEGRPLLNFKVCLCYILIKSQTGY